MDCIEITIFHKNLQATISSLGAQLLSLKKDGKEIIFQGNEFWKGRCPVLFPNAGGLINDTYYLDKKAYPLAKHGFIRFKEFDVLSKNDSCVSLIRKQDKETLDSFPFTFDFIVTYSFENDALAITYSVKNTDKRTMYFTLGAHEGYVIDDDLSLYSLRFEKEENLKSLDLVGKLLGHSTTDFSQFKKELPLSYNYFKQDAIVFKDINSRKVSLLKNGVEQVEVCFPDSNDLLIWSIPNAKFVCIEPWHGIPDYVDSELDIKAKYNVVSLEANKEFKLSHYIEAK